MMCSWTGIILRIGRLTFPLVLANESLVFNLPKVNLSFAVLQRYLHTAFDTTKKVLHMYIYVVVTYYVNI